MTPKRLVWYFLPFIMLGCSPEENSSNNNADSNIDQNVLSGNLYVKDISKRFPLEIVNHINLSQEVKSTIEQDIVHLADFKSLSSEEKCNYFTIKDMDITFSIDDTLECYYNYTVKSQLSEELSSGLIRASFSNDPLNSKIIRISAVTSIGNPISIDLSDGSLPEGYQIDFDNMLILGDGRVTKDDIDNKVIYYPGENDSDSGITRILFSYINQSDGSIIPGTIDISVAIKGINHPPIAQSFRYGNIEKFKQGQQLPHISVPIGEKVIIDIAPYYNQGYLNSDNKPIQMLDNTGNVIVNDDGEPAHYYIDENGLTTDIYSSGVHLIDQDKDLLQLLDVYAYNSFVSTYRAQEDDYYSTKFSFASSTEGLHYVTYVLSDHHGGYSTGIIEIQVGIDRSNIPWEEKLYTAKFILLSPYSKQEADYAGYRYDSISTENGLKGPDTWSTPKFSYKMAQSICQVNNLRLPSESELLSLKNEYPDGLFLSSDLNNSSKTVNWPTSAKFWTTSDMVVSLSDFSVESVDTNVGTYALACLSPGVIKSTSIDVNNSFRLPFDNSSYNIMSIKLTDLQGHPLVNEKITAIYANNLIVHKANELISDQNGEVKISVSSKSAGAQTVKLLYMFDEESVELNFKDIPAYVRTEKISKSNKRNLCFFNSLEAMAEGDCSVANHVVYDIYDGYASDMMFSDGKKVYRRYDTAFGGYIYAHDDILSAARGTGPDWYKAPPNTTSEYATFYDGKKYWVASQTLFEGWNRPAMKSYFTLGDFLSNKNIVTYDAITEELQSATFMYDPVSHLYYAYYYSLNALVGYQSMDDLVNDRNRSAIIKVKNMDHSKNKFYYLY